MAKAVSIAVLSLFCLCARVSGSTPGSKHWGYDGELGPDRWTEVSETCGGSQQSPIDIDPDKAVSEQFAPLFFSNYDVKVKELMLRNNGHSIVVSLNTNRTPSIAEGGLIGKYNFVQLHLHWGKNSSRGSEHSVKGIKYPGEVHFVHFNSKYSNLSAALDHPDGLAALGVFVKIGTSDNSVFKDIIDAAENIEKAGEETKIEVSLALKDFLPSSLGRFYRYSGSLTTPNCNEAVTWTVFDKPISFSDRQFGNLRKILTVEGHPLEDAFRPLQKLNGRTVRVRSGSATLSIGPLLLPVVMLISFLGFNVQSGF